MGVGLYDQECCCIGEGFFLELMRRDSVAITELFSCLLEYFNYFIVKNGG